MQMLQPLQTTEIPINITFFKSNLTSNISIINNKYAAVWDIAPPTLAPIVGYALVINITIEAIIIDHFGSFLL